jgi:hypothetical protein
MFDLIKKIKIAGICWFTDTMPEKTKNKLVTINLNNY